MPTSALPYDELLAAAEAVAKRAHAPYSRFLVGAALLTEDGTVVAGCNVENVSYGLTICAERNAIFAAVAQGHTSFQAIAIVQGSADGPAPAGPCSPCGACRQVMAEFNPKLPVILRSPEGPLVQNLEMLLPSRFDLPLPAVHP